MAGRLHGAHQRLTRAQSLPALLIEAWKYSEEVTFIPTKQFRAGSCEIALSSRFCGSTQDILNRRTSDSNTTFVNSPGAPSGG
jgi:hypothetical protein